MSTAPLSPTIPAAVWALAFGVFALVTSEFQISALMTLISEDLHISLPLTGYLITVYALAMAVGGPLLTMLLLRQPPRITLFLLLTLFILSQTLAALAPNYLVLTLARVLTGAVAGAFIGAAVGSSVKLVAAELAPKAITVVLTGLMAGTVLGLPLANLIGNLAGWRVSFGAVVGISLLALAGCGYTLPRQMAQDALSLGSELRALRNPTLWRAYSTSLLIIGATFAAFSYFTPILSAETGFSAGQVTLLLLVYGLATVVGTLVVGRLSANYALPALVAGFVALALCFGLFALFIHQTGVAIVAVIGAGLFGVTMNPAMIARVMQAAGNRPLVNTVHTSMITSGIMIGSLLSGLGISWGYGLSAPLWTGVAMALCGLLTLLPDMLSRQPESCQQS